MSNQRITATPILALLTAVIIWGYNFIPIKQLLPHLDSYTLAFYSITGTALMLIIWRGKGLCSYRKSLILKSCVSGFFGVFLFNSLLYFGLTKTSPIDAALIISLIPSGGTLVNHFYFKNRAHVSDIMAVLLATFGVVLLVTNGKFNNLHQTNILGDGIILCGVCGFIIYTAIGKSVLELMSPIHYTTWCFIAGSVFLFLVALGWGNIFGIKNLAGIDFVYLFYTMLFAGLIASIAYNFGLNRTNILLASLFVNATPIFTTLFAVIFYGETLTFIKILAGVIIIISTTTPIVLQSFRHAK